MNKGKRQSMTGLGEDVLLVQGKVPEQEETHHNTTTPQYHNTYKGREIKPKRATFYLKPKPLNFLDSTYVQAIATKEGRDLNKSKMIDILVTRAIKETEGKDINGIIDFFNR